MLNAPWRLTHDTYRVEDLCVSDPCTFGPASLCLAMLGQCLHVQPSIAVPVQAKVSWRWTGAHSGKPF